MTKNSRPVAKWGIGELVQSKAGGPKLAVDAIQIPTGPSALSRIAEDFDGKPLADEKEPDSGIKYWCIWWVGSKRNREQFSEGGLKNWVEPVTK